MTIHIFGHRSPDVDAIVSALTLAHFFEAQGIRARAYRLGEINTETRYLLTHFGVAAPPYLDPDALSPTLPTGASVALTDHNEPAHSIATLNQCTISHVIDHHKVGFATATCPYVRIEPVGCTCTILLDMLDSKGIAIPPTFAALMSGAIISDTLNLTSPTTTDQDRHALARLASIAMIDTDALAKAQFAAKSDVSHLDARAVLLMDFKSYYFGDQGVHWGIAGIESTSPNDILARRQELIAVCDELKQELGLDYLLIVVVDIIAQVSHALRYDPAIDAIITQMFVADISDTHLSLPKVVSRKRQLVPALENYYKSH